MRRGRTWEELSAMPPDEREALCSNRPIAEVKMAAERKKLDKMSGEDLHHLAVCLWHSDRPAAMRAVAKLDANLETYDAFLRLVARTLGDGCRGLTRSEIAGNYLACIVTYYSGPNDQRDAACKMLALAAFVIPHANASAYNPIKEPLEHALIYEILQLPRFMPDKGCFLAVVEAEGSLMCDEQLEA